MDDRKDTRYKWLLLGLLTVTYFLMHGSRQIFNASLPDIKHCLPGTSDAEWGLTRTVFLFAYGLVVPLAGIAADMLRRKWVLVVGALVFSVGVFFTGFVGGFIGMLCLYGILNGVGQCMIPAHSFLPKASSSKIPPNLYQDYFTSKNISNYSKQHLIY